MSSAPEASPLFRLCPAASSLINLLFVLLFTILLSLSFQAIACLTASVTSAPEPEAEASPQFGGNNFGNNPLQAVSPGNFGGNNFGGNNFARNNFVDSGFRNQQSFATTTLNRPVAPLLDIRNPLHLIRNPLTDSRRSDELLLSSAYTSALR